MTEPAAPPAEGTPAAAPAAAPAPAAPTPAPAASAAWWEGKITEPEIVEYAKAKNYANPEEALRAAWSANKMNKLEPAVMAFMEGKATPEQETAVLNKFRPESPDKYEFKYGEGVTVDKDLETLGRSIFHELGATPAKAQAMMDKWNTAVAAKAASNADAERIANDTALANLSKEWGDQLEPNRAAGDRVLKSLNLPEAAMAAIEAKIGTAEVVQLLAAIGRKSAEGSFKGGNENPPGDPNDPNSMTPEHAQARMNALRADAAFSAKYENKDNPGHAEAVQLMLALAAKASAKK